MSTMLPTVTITTDGSARGNPGPGGWAALLETGSNEKLLTGQEPSKTTNNAMEVAAVVGALSFLKRPCHIVLRCNSEYVLGGLERILAGKPAPTASNPERWAALAAATAGHRIELTWVRAHNGDPRNERVDDAARAAANAAAAAVEAQTTRAADEWTITLRSWGAGAEWQLATPDAALHGQGLSSPANTDLTSLYHALIAALEAAKQQPGSQRAALRVLVSNEVMVKQGRGEWKVKQPAQQPLAAAVARLRAHFRTVEFSHRAKLERATTDS